MTDPDDRVALKPCPFCGHDWPLIVTHSSEATTDYSVRCYQGCAETAGDEDRDEAIKLWNTRALSPDDAVTEAMIEAGARAMAGGHSIGAEIEDIIATMYSAMRALAKPDEGVGEEGQNVLVGWLDAFKADPFSRGRDKVSSLLKAFALASLSDNDEGVGG